MLSYLKLTANDFAGKDVSSLPDKPSEAYMTAGELKAAFDRAAKEVLAPRINELLAVLSSNLGAAHIGTSDGQSVEERFVPKSEDHYFLSSNGTGSHCEATLRRSGNALCLKGTAICQSGFTGGMPTTVLTLPVEFAPDYEVKMAAVAFDGSNALVPAMLSVNPSGAIAIYPNAKTYTVELNLMWIAKEVSA